MAEAQGRDTGEEDGGQAPAGAAVLALSQVAFAWPGRGSFSLRIEQFSVAAGERLLVMGASGSGKSTFLSLLCGILRPRAGSILVAGTDIARLSGGAADRFRAEHFGIIFQLFNLLPYGSMLDNVLLPLSFAPERRRRAGAEGPPAAEARRLLGRLGLEEAMQDRSTANLSVGQQQRVAVARALIGGPAIVIADEPTSALDRDRQDAFLALLFEEVARAGAALIMVSHDDTLAPRFERTLSLEEIAVTAGPAAA